MRLLVSGATTSLERFAADPELSPHLGHLWTPATANSLDRQVRTGLPWACDNAAFGAQWDTESFQKAVYLKIATATAPPLFVPCPDVVGDSRATLDLFTIWAGLLGVDTCDGSSLSVFPDTWVPKFVERLRAWEADVRRDAPGDEVHPDPRSRA